MIKNIKKVGLASVLTAALILGGTAGAFAVEGDPITTIPTVSETPAATPVATPAPMGPHKRAVAAFRVANTEFKTKMLAFKAERITYKAAFDSYRVIEKAYNTAKRAIATTYRTAVGSANTAYKLVSENTASTIEQLNAAKVIRDAAIASATTARDTAITALGAAPVAPAKPMPPVKPIRPTKEPKPAPSSSPTAAPAPVVTPAPTAPTA